MKYAITPVSAVTEHVWQKKHQLEFQLHGFLTQEPNLHQCCFLESWHIQKQQPSIWKGDHWHQFAKFKFFMYIIFDCIVMHLLVFAIYFLVCIYIILYIYIYIYMFFDYVFDYLVMHSLILHSFFTSIAFSAFHCS